MILITPKCPECDEEAEGSVDTVPGIALFGGFDEDGGTTYAGDTRMCWDGQMSDWQPGKGMLVQCTAAHEWYTHVVDVATTPEKKWIVTLDNEPIDGEEYDDEEAADAAAVRQAKKLRESA